MAALSALSFSTLPLSVSGMVNSSAIATTTSSPEVYKRQEKDGSGQAYAPGSKPDLSERTEPLVLYAQWKPVYVAKVEEPKPNEPQTGGTLTIKPRPTPAPDPGTGTGPEPTEPEKPAPIKETQKVLVGVYLSLIHI